MNGDSKMWLCCGLFITLLVGWAVDPGAPKWLLGMALGAGIWTALTMVSELWGEKKKEEPGGEQDDQLASDLDGRGGG